jgi:hypothetical protein
MYEAYWEGDLQYSPGETPGQLDIIHRFDGDFYDIGTVEKVAPHDVLEYWRAIDLNENVNGPYATKTMAARSLTRNKYDD